MSILMFVLTLNFELNDNKGRNVLTAETFSMCFYMENCVYKSVYKCMYECVYENTFSPI